MELWVGLTAIAILANWVAAARAIHKSLLIEEESYFCRTSTRHCGLQILLGFAAICILVGALKLWSTLVVYFDLMDYPKRMIHIRWYAWLAENYGVAILCWHVTSYIDVVSKCKRGKLLEELTKKK